MPPPKVSVLIITYNHEHFIAQAIESALQQKTDFDFEIVIGEDCSTDHTRDIVVSFQTHFPHKIRLLLHEKNIGPNRNFVQTLQCCRGEYIAILEGDDYWTSPTKLQKQVEFLESNSDCVFCFHDVDIVDERGKYLAKYPPSKLKDKIALEDYLSEVYNTVHLASAVLRANQIDPFPAWYFDLPMGDWLLFILCLQKGKGGYLKGSMAVWRHHKGGIWSQKPKESVWVKTIEAARILRFHLGYAAFFDKIMSFYLQRLAFTYAEANDFASAAKAASQALELRNGLSLRIRIELMKIILIRRLPRLYGCYSKLKRTMIPVPRI